MISSYLESCSRLCSGRSNAYGLSRHPAAVYRVSVFDDSFQIYFAVYFLRIVQILSMHFRPSICSTCFQDFLDITIDLSFQVSRAIFQHFQTSLGPWTLETCKSSRTQPVISYLENIQIRNVHVLVALSHLCWRGHVQISEALDLACAPGAPKIVAPHREGEQKEV